MKGLKYRVDTALHDLSIIRRNEILSWEANDSLRISAKIARKSSIRKVDQGLSRLEIYRNKVQDLRVDTNTAHEWTGFVQSILAEIEVREQSFLHNIPSKRNLFEMRYFSFSKCDYLDFYAQKICLIKQPSRLKDIRLIK